MLFLFVSDGLFSVPLQLYIFVPLSLFPLHLWPHWFGDRTCFMHLTFLECRRGNGFFLPSEIKVFLFYLAWPKSSQHLETVLLWSLLKLKDLFVHSVFVWSLKRPTHFFFSLFYTACISLLWIPSFFSFTMQHREKGCSWNMKWH